MRDFVLARLAIFVGTVVGAAVVLFLLFDILPGAGASERPAWLRFVGMFLGDTAVAPGKLGERLAVTIPLVLLALLVAVMAGLGLGLAAGRFPATAVDRLVRALAAVLALLPPFWLGLLLALLFAGGLKLLPASGFVPWGGNVLHTLGTLLLPALALGLPYAGQLALRVRRDLGDLPTADILRLRAEGLPLRQAAWRLGLARVLPALPGLAGRSFVALLIGSTLVESVFYLPGLGRQILGAAEQQDLAALHIGLLALAVIAAFGVLALALLRLPLDPAFRREAPQ